MFYCVGEIFLKKKTHEDFVTQMNKINSGLSFTGKYIGANKKISYLCTVCNHNDSAYPTNLLRGNGCPKCASDKLSILFSDSHNSFCEKVRKAVGHDYTIIGVYEKNGKPVLVRHDVCGGEYDVIPNSIKGGHKCPFCSNSKVLIGLNDIWTTNPSKAALMLDPKYGFEYLDGSEKKVMFVCPTCGRKELKVIANVNPNTYSCCACGKGFSYPERMFFSFLNCLGVNFKQHLKFDWAPNKQYDFIIENSIICETMGIQHFRESFSKVGGRTLKEEQENDALKERLAFDNGFKKYIKLDCSKSDFEFIKNSIIKSELSILFDLSNFDWNTCEEKIYSSVLKEIASLWNANNTIKQICNNLKINENTVRSNLKTGTRLGLCTYVPANFKNQYYKRVD